METEQTDDFPRREFTESKVPYQACAYVVSLIFSVMVVLSAGAISPDFPAKLPIGLITWCAFAVTCIVIVRRLLLRVNFEKPVVILDANAVTFLQPRTITLPWSAISKVSFRESGQYRLIKTFVFEMENGSELECTSTLIANMSARQLFEWIRIYHRKFGPQVPAIPGYDSSGWTGE